MCNGAQWASVRAGEQAGRRGRKEGGRRCWFMTMMGVMSKRANPELVLEKFNFICVLGKGKVCGGCVCGTRLDGWMNGWMDGWMDGWVDVGMISIGA